MTLTRFVLQYQEINRRLGDQEIIPGRRSVRTPVNGESETEGVSLDVHLKCVVEVGKFRYKKIWLLAA